MLFINKEHRTRENNLFRHLGKAAALGRAFLHYSERHIILSNAKFCLQNL